MNRSRHQHPKNYYMIIGGRNFKDACHEKTRAEEGRLLADLKKAETEEDIEMVEAKASETKIKTDPWRYD
jgi:hypothetical protein